MFYIYDTNNNLKGKYEGNYLDQLHLVGATVNEGEDSEYNISRVTNENGDEVTEEILETNARARRNTELINSDFTQLSDSPFTIEQKNLYYIYRQKLRELPEQSGFPATITWPAKPI